MLKMKLSAARAHLLVAVLICCTPSFVSAQVVLKDDTVLTLKEPESPFLTEGPISGLNITSPAISVLGIKVTIPKSIDGTTFLVTGPSVLGQDGKAVPSIGVANFERLVDANANVPGPLRLGATRSIFSTTEARLVDSVTQSAIETRFAAMVQACYDAHGTALPTGFPQRAGTSLYPATSGGTLKSVGRIYEDTAGNEYYIPDGGAAVEMAENIIGGVVTSAKRGDATLPDSFVIGDLLLIFNQDPRFGSEVLGLGEAIIPRKVFFDQILLAPTYVDVSGYSVGDHVFFVQEVLTELIDPESKIRITADRFNIRLRSREARWIGTVDKPAGIILNAVMLRETTVGQTPQLTPLRAPIRIPLAIDPLTGAATYSARVSNQFVSTMTHIRMEAMDAGVLVASELYDIRPFRA